MQVINTSFAIGTWDAADNILRITWKGHMPDGGFQDVVQQLVRIIREKKVVCYLTDTSQSGPVTNDMQRWMATEIIPALARDGLRYMAIVTPVRPTAGLGVAVVEQVLNINGIETRQFATYDAADAWLRAAK